MNSQQISGLGNVVISCFFFLIPLLRSKCCKPQASTHMLPDMGGPKLSISWAGPCWLTRRSPPPLPARWDKSWKTTNVWQHPHCRWAPAHNDWLEPVSPTAVCFFMRLPWFSKAVLCAWSSPFGTIFQWQDDDPGGGQRCETAEQKEAEEGKCLESRGTQGPLCHGLCPHVRSERCKRTKLCCFYTLKSTACAQVVTWPMTLRNSLAFVFSLRSPLLCSPVVGQRSPREEAARDPESPPSLFLGPRSSQEPPGGQESCIPFLGDAACPPAG